MKETRTNKGITLIALIITIIVLLILALVSIKLVINSGIVTRANTSKEDQIIEQEKEQIQLKKAFIIVVLLHELTHLLLHLEHAGEEYSQYNRSSYGVDLPCYSVSISFREQSQQTNSCNRRHCGTAQNRGCGAKNKSHKSRLQNDCVRLVLYARHCAERAC